MITTRRLFGVLIVLLLALILLSACASDSARSTTINGSGSITSNSSGSNGSQVNGSGSNEIPADLSPGNENPRAGSSSEELKRSAEFEAFQVAMLEVKSCLHRSQIEFAYAFRQPDVISKYFQRPPGVSEEQQISIYEDCASASQVEEAEGALLKFVEMTESEKSQRRAKIVECLATLGYDIDSKTNPLEIAESQDYDHCVNGKYREFFDNCLVNKGYSLNKIESDLVKVDDKANCDEAYVD